MSRDDQFERFAILLSRDLFNIRDVGFMSTRDDWREEWMRTIARRAYDLAMHVLTETPQMEREGIVDRLDAKLALEHTPDMRQWPEETK